MTYPFADQSCEACCGLVPLAASSNDVEQRRRSLRRRLRMGQDLCSFSRPAKRNRATMLPAGVTLGRNRHRRNDRVRSRRHLTYLRRQPGRHSGHLRRVVQHGAKERPARADRPRHPNVGAMQRRNEGRAGHQLDAMPYHSAGKPPVSVDQLNTLLSACGDCLREVRAEVSKERKSCPPGGRDILRHVAGVRQRSAPQSHNESLNADSVNLLSRARPWRLAQSVHGTSSATRAQPAAAETNPAHPRIRGKECVRKVFHASTLEQRVLFLRELFNSGTQFARLSPLRSHELADIRRKKIRNDQAVWMRARLREYPRL